MERNSSHTIMTENITADCNNSFVNETLSPTCDSNTTLLFDSGATLKEKHEIVITCVMLSVIWVVGVLGNGLVLHTYKKRYDKFSSHLFLFAIGITDFLTCLLLIPQTLYLFVFQRNETHFKIIATILVMVVMTSILLLSGMAVDRWAAIKYPFLFAIARKRVQGIIAGALSLAALLAVIYSINSFVGVRLAASVIGLSLFVIMLMYAAIVKFVCGRNRIDPAIDTNGILQLAPLEPSLEPPMQSNQENNSHPRQLSVVQPSTSTTTNYLSPYQSSTKHEASSSLHISTQNSSHSGHSQHLSNYTTTLQEMQQQVRKQKLRNHLIKTVRLLFLIILSYIISFLPSLIIVFNVSNIPTYYVNTYYISHAVNPIIYSFTNQEFRKQLLHLRKGHCCKN